MHVVWPRGAWRRRWSAGQLGGACGAAARVMEEAAAARVGGPWRRRPAVGALELRPDVRRERLARAECG